MDFFGFDLVVISKLLTPALIGLAVVVVVVVIVSVVISLKKGE